MELLNASNRSDMQTSRSFYNRDLSLHRASQKLFSEHVIPLAQPVNFTAFSPFDNSFDILACGTKERVYIFRITILDNAQGPGEELEFQDQFIQQYITGSRATSIAFSPKTDFSRTQNNILNFAVASDDFGILLLKQVFPDDSGNSESSDNYEQQFISGHTDYINDMAFEPISGDLLASTSDDCTCCVWSLNGEAIEGCREEKNGPEMRIQLTSPGINVKWHSSEPNKLFVSEKKGLIRFYDTNSRVAVMTFECNRYPLMSSDWCNDNTFIGCAAGRDVFFWDTSLTSLPVKVVKTNSEGLSEFAFYDNKIIAYRGRPSNFLKVQNFQNNQLYIDKEFVAGRGLSWNQKLPLLAVGGAKAVHIFKINTL